MPDPISPSEIAVILRDQEKLSSGEIAVIVSDLTQGKKNAEGAAKLLAEINRSLRAGEGLTKFAEYLEWATRRFMVHGDANRAFGTCRPDNRPKLNADRDVMIAFLVQRELNRHPHKELSIDGAAMEVRDHLAVIRNPPIKLSYDRIAKIYKDNKGHDLVRVLRGDNVET